MNWDQGGPVLSRPDPNDPEITIPELRDFLSKDTTLDLSKFNRRKGFRTLLMLLKEINGGDIRLVFHEEMGRVILLRVSIWVIIETEDGYRLRERWRWYPKTKFLWIFRMTWRKVEIQSIRSYSESIKVGREDAVTAAHRGMQEELLYLVPKPQFRPVNLDAHDESPLDLSTVYPGLLTKRFISIYTCTLPRRPSIEDVVTRDDEDGDVMLSFLEWEYLKEKEDFWRKKLPRRALSWVIKARVIIRYLV